MDQAKGRWKPSEFIVENDDGTKNISSVDMYDGYEITASPEYYTDKGLHIAALHFGMLVMAPLTAVAYGLV